jgi:hypothetical protein
VLGRSVCIFLAIVAIAPSAAFARSASISQRFKGDRITISVDGTRFAGAISSLTFRNVQYVDIADHGREIQSAIQVDNLGECFNPNEAGAESDHTAPSSSSRLLSLSNAGNVLRTVTRPAFWLSPNQKYGRPCSPRTNAATAQNQTILSNYTIARRTSFYGASIPNLIRADVSFRIPEKRGSASIEALTGYLPATFNRWFQYDPATHRVEDLKGSSTNQRTTLPLIVATADGKNAMGVISPGISPGNDSQGYYAYFTFGGRTPSSKWACVYNHGSISAGTILSYTCLMAVGTVDEVESALSAYAARR